MEEKFTDIDLLRKIPVLGSLSEAVLQKIIKAPENRIQVFEPKQVIVRESEIGDCMYIVLEGTVEVSIRGEGGGVIGREVSIATLRAGDFFGEGSITSDTTGRRKATVKAFQRSKLFRIDKKYVHIGVQKTPAADEEPDDTTDKPVSGNSEVIDLMKGMRMFQSLKQEELASVNRWAEVIEVEPGDFVLKESQRGECLFVILSGSVEIFTLDDSDKIVILAEHQRGDYFGEQALMPGSSGERNAYARSNGHTKLIKIPKAYFRLVLNRDSELSSALEKIGSAQKQEINKLQNK